MENEWKSAAEIGLNRAGIHFIVRSRALNHGNLIDIVSTLDSHYDTPLKVSKFLRIR